MDPEEITALLALQRRAYELVLHLAGLARREPAFMKNAARHLSSRRECESWLRAERGQLPEHLYPRERDMRPFAQLVWSFFHVSFRIDTMEWDGRVLDAHVVTHKGRPRARGAAGLRSVKRNALRQLHRRRGLELPAEALTGMLGDRCLREPLALWTYVWELRQRARGKTKGRVLHQLWRSLDLDVRKNLDAEAVIEAMDALIVEPERGYPCEAEGEARVVES